MLRQILTAILLILLPYVVYGIIGIVRRRLAQREISPIGFWEGAPVLALGLVGCALAVAVLIAIAVLSNDPNQPVYVPPVSAGRP